MKGTITMSYVDMPDDDSSEQEDREWLVQLSVSIVAPTLDAATDIAEAYRQQMGDTATVWHITEVVG